MIHVLANLQPGEHVLMTPPLSDTGMPDETQPGGLSDATVKDLAKRARKAPEASATPQQPGSTKPRKKPRTEGAARRGNPPGAKP